VIEAPVPAAAKITDLTEALRASVEAIRKQKGTEAEPEEAAPRGRSRKKSA